MIHFTILGDPKAQKRHRNFARMGKGGKVFTGNYDPSIKEKESFVSIAHKFAPERPLEGALQVDLIFYMPRTQNHFKTSKKGKFLKDDAPVWHISRPDKDNLEKLVYDALNGVFWKDDSQICYGVTKKKYSDRPRTEVYIYQI